MDYGGLATELGVDNLEGTWSCLCAAQEIDVEGEGVGLVLGCESCGEVKLCYCEEVTADDAAVRDWWWVSICF